MGVEISTITDILTLTRATELAKGEWVSLVSDLPEYPLHQGLIPRVTRKSSYKFAWTLTRQGANPFRNGGYTGVNVPLQVSVDPLAKRLEVPLAKIRFATAYAEDEEELQGDSDTELADAVLMRKSEDLDQPLLSFMEHALAGAPSSASSTYKELFGLEYWFPSTVGLTAVDMDGGTDPVGFSGGAAGLTVAECPEWAHAVGGFSKVSNDDLFKHIADFRMRVNYHVPSGSKSADSATPNRIILCQYPVFLEWAEIQTAANDNLKSDVGMWRGAINYMSTPVRKLPVISEVGSAERPTDRGILYDLDLNTLQLVVNDRFNFELKVLQKSDTPGVVHAYREGYVQLICKNRRKNLVLATQTSGLY